MCFNEGCLSIPEIRAEIKRPNMIKVEFLDENFNHNSIIFKGLLARVILHENDHINGVLFTDKISSFKRKIIQNKLIELKKGKSKLDTNEFFIVKELKSLLNIMDDLRSKCPWDKKQTIKVLKI